MTRLSKSFLIPLFFVLGFTGCRPTAIPEGSFILRVSEVFRSDTELVAKLTIETRAPTRYTLETKGGSGGGRGGGTTRAQEDSAEGPCADELWLSASYVSYSNDEADYLKVEVKHAPVHSTSVQKLPNTTPKEAIQFHVKDGIHTMSLAQPYLFARMGEEDYFLTVGITTNDLVQQGE